MRRFLLLFTLICVWSQLHGQTLNQNANWPNTNWSLTGVFDANYLYENPTVSGGSSNFYFDDDAAGGGSINNVIVESPIINLNAPFSNSEYLINVTVPYVLNVFQTETLILEYWDADAEDWIIWDDGFTDNSGLPTDFCDGNPTNFVSEALNISGFTTAQLENFRYRINYNDNGSWGWGLCVSSPTITSSAPPACPGVVNLAVSNITASSAQITWQPGDDEISWEVAVILGTSTIPVSGVNSNNSSFNATDLNQSTTYTVYVRANCAVDGVSNWDSVSFTTGVDTSAFPTAFTPNPINTTGTYDIALVDLNGDFLDDVVSVSSSNINVHYQLATGGFNSANISTPSADNAPSWSLAAGDYDANGYNDLVYGGGSGVTFMQANNDGTAYTEFSGPDYVFSQRSNFVDINNDSHLDAFVCHDVDANVYYINDGSGNLTFYQGESPGVVPNGLGLTDGGGNYGTVWIDYDNDRDMDLFIAKCRGGSTTISTNELWRNDGNGVFVNVADSNGWYNTNYPGVGHNNSSNLGDNVQTWSSAWADFDNDGDMDVFVGASSTSNGNSKLMRNNGDGTFTDATAGSGVLDANLGIENAPADFDNDGYVDILSNSNILFNNGDFTFTNYSLNMPMSGAIGDTNNDGFLDVFRNGTIYLNNTNDNNWVKLTTVGMGHATANMSNRNGIGARVELITASGTQIRDVRSGEGFEFMSTLNTHFGLGSESSIQEIRIYWPSGTVDVITNPDINTTHNIIEGSTLSISDERLNDLSIYPNPVEDKLRMHTSTNLVGKIATVFDITGKRVLSEKITAPSIVDVNYLQPGLYTLRIESQGRVMTKKFIKN